MSTSCFCLGCDKWEEEKEGRLFLRLRVGGWGVVVERRRSTVNLPKRSVCDSDFRVGENGRFRGSNSHCSHLFIHVPSVPRQGKAMESLLLHWCGPLRFFHSNINMLLLLLHVSIIYKILQIYFRLRVTQRPMQASGSIRDENRPPTYPNTR